MSSSNEPGPTAGTVDPEVTAEPGGRDEQQDSTAGVSRLDHALRYASIGWPVLAVDPRTKRPIPGCGLSTATTDPERIAAWWQRAPGAAPAVACRAAGLVVVDLDVNHRDGADGLAWWEAHASAEPNRAFVARTPAGGRHLVFAAPDGPELRSGRIAPGVDVKAGGGEFGGYVVLPSTSDDGRVWDGDDPRDGGALTPPPQWFVAFARAKLPPQNDVPKSPPSNDGTAHHAGTAPDERFAEVRSALAAIPPSVGRDAWLRAIHGTHAALGGDLRGAGLVESWSAGTTVTGQYKPGESARIYRHARPPQSAEPGGRQLVDANSLFGLAYANGWAGPDVEQQPVQQAVEVKADATGRPVVDTATPYHVQVARALDVLRQRSDIAQREGRLVRVVDLDRLRTAPLTRGAIRELLSESARWVGRQGTKPREVDPPALVVDALTEHRHDWPLPVLRADASASAAVQAIRDRGAIQRIPTGIAAIDFATGGGLPRIGRVGLQGPPSASKTMMLVAMLDAMASRGVHVGLLAVDEDREDIVGRLLQRRGCERRDVDDLVSVDVERALRDVEHLPLRIYDATWTIDRAAADLARVAGDGPMVLGVDSIQTARCEADDDRENETANVAARMQAIRDASVRHRMLIVATSEVGRAAYRDVEGRSAVAALAAGKHSGSIEYAMRILVDLRPARGTDDIVELRFAKNKNGAETRPGEPGAFVRIDRATQTVAPADDYQPPAEDDADDERLDAARQHAAVVALWLADHPGRGRREMHRGLRGQGTARTAADAGLGVLENAGAIVEQRAPRNAVWTYLDGARVPDEVLAHVRPEDRARIRAVRPPQPPPDGPDGECAAECASTLDTLTTGTPSSVCARPPIGGATHSHSASVRHDPDDGVPERPKGKRRRRSKSAGGRK